ncbi:MAG: HDOD domain-containing protein [Pseudomonadales bacterium]
MGIEIEPQEQEIIDGLTIPPRPQALITILNESKKGDPDFTIISHAIAEDVSIASALLKVVNSAAFRRANPISSIDQALSLLGLKRILAVVNVVAIRNVAPANLDLEDFWAMASTVANASASICQELDLKHLSDDAYTLGLFHNSGVPILMNYFDIYQEFYQLGEKEGWIQTIEMEKTNFHTTHTTIGALLAQDWCLPYNIVEAIYNLHYADGIFSDKTFDDVVLKLIAILKISREITHIFLYGQTTNEWSHIEDQILHYLNLEDTTYEDIKNFVLRRLREHD